MTNYIAPRTEALARAMCEALDHADADAKIGGTTPVWMVYRWAARAWIYEHSNGKLPEREGEG